MGRMARIGRGLARICLYQEIRMRKSSIARRAFGVWAGVTALGMALGALGCSGGTIEEGMPEDTGYTPLKQPSTATVKGKPKLGVTEEERKAGIEKADELVKEHPPESKTP